MRSVGSTAVQLYSTAVLRAVTAAEGHSQRVPLTAVQLSIPQVSTVARADLLLPIFSIHSYP